MADRPAEARGRVIEVDLGAVEPVALVRWLPGSYQEVPGGLTLDVSTDGRSWQRLADVPEYEGPLYWSAGRPMARVRGGRVELKVPARSRHGTSESRRRAATPRGGGRCASCSCMPPDLASRQRSADRARGRGPPGRGGDRAIRDPGWASRIALADPTVRIPPTNLAIDA